MSTTKILSITGDEMATRHTLPTDPVAAANALPGEQPTEHSRFYNQKMKSYAEGFEVLTKKCLETLNTPTADGQPHNMEQIKAYYGQQWAEVVSTELTGPDPVPLEKDRFYTWWDRTMKANDMKAQRKLPLNQVLDLTPFGFLPLGPTTHGMVWLSTRVALCISDGGMVLMLLNTPGHTMTEWFKRRYKNVAVWATAYQFEGYRLEEMVTAMSGLRMVALSHPSEAEMDLARGGTGKPKEDGNAGTN